MEEMLNQIEIQLFCTRNFSLHLKPLIDFVGADLVILVAVLHSRLSYGERF